MLWFNKMQLTWNGRGKESNILPLVFKKRNDVDILKWSNSHLISSTSLNGTIECVFPEIFEFSYSFQFH